MRGPGFSFSVPAGWDMAHTGRSLAAHSGRSEVSATTFTLLKPYVPALFPRVVAELDRNAASLAQQAHGTLTDKTTVMVAGRKTRVYRYTAKGYVTRIGFVLQGKREVQLLCRAPAGAGDPAGACDLIFRTFRLTKPS